MVWKPRYNKIVLFLTGFVMADDKRKNHVAHRQNKSKVSKAEYKLKTAHRRKYANFYTSLPVVWLY